ncbi:uncharacterized protein [Neodiprion pinetum]|uniref:Uncharacterized protein LOC107216815 n=1 Tax=Neodiprion lecontei TaxID=441921 RepID=A0ABM3FEZ0_NEOLC|nr:uncharacterized protein LOC124211332 [Neodiprion pinetum]XP_046586548.1 uncharacterized protein LOC107216815 [Neodiprion lecontei]
MRRNENLSQELQEDTGNKLPRKESILDIRPAYNCIHKHLKQTDVFQEKAKRTLWKERLEIEIMNSRISCINKLLRPEAPQSQWRKSRSPKVFYRDGNAIKA